MFLFCFAEYPLVLMNGGWNLSHHRMTIQTFYRWLDIIDDHYRDRNLNFQLRKINLRRFDVLRYVVDSSEGPMLPRDSVEFLQPGVYGPFLDGQPYRGQVGNSFHPSTLRGLEQRAGRMGEDIGMDLNRHNKMPQDVSDAVTTRDGGVCCVTGRADLPTSVIWAFPPSLAYMSYQERDGGKEGLYEAYRTVDNAITLCTALIEPFMENMFSVDIEDNSHIITFLDLPTRVPTAPSVPSHLPRHCPSASLTATFWHLHFNGPSAFEPQDPHPQDLMDDLVEDCADLQDAKWQSGIGAEVLAEFLQQQMCIKSAHEGFDDEYDDESEGSVDSGQSLSDFGDNEDGATTPV
ncbi:hypothetical protein B0H14DRAFT_2845105 [Mycena olivaceomarginata]|nr:hypothetical protein B0H14DRAFT_2845105 [Mycena olivaceomarginata]